MSDSFETSGIRWPKFNPAEKPKDTRENYACYLAGRDFHTSRPYKNHTYAANVKIWGFNWGPLDTEDAYRNAAFEEQEHGNWYNFNFHDMRREFEEENFGWTVQFGGRSGGWMELVDTDGHKGYFARYNVEDRQMDRLAEILNYDANVWSGELSETIAKAGANAQKDWWDTNWKNGETSMQIRQWRKALDQIDSDNPLIPQTIMERLSREIAQYSGHLSQYREHMRTQAERTYRRTHPHPGTKNQWLAYPRDELREEFNLVWNFYEFAERCCQDYAYYIWDEVNNA